MPMRSVLLGLLSCAWTFPGWAQSDPCGSLDYDAARAKYFSQETPRGRYKALLEEADRGDPEARSVLRAIGSSLCGIETSQAYTRRILELYRAELLFQARRLEEQAGESGLSLLQRMDLRDRAISLRDKISLLDASQLFNFSELMTQEDLLDFVETLARASRAR